MSIGENTECISIDCLQPGMFIVSLDIQWIDSPFINDARLIRNFNEIELLKNAGVKTLTIDPSRSIQTPNGNQSRDQASSNNLTSNSLQQSHSEQQHLEIEMQVAYQLREEVKGSVQKIYADIEQEASIDCDSLEALVEKTLKSLQRNNQALLNLAHIARASRKLVDHAFSTFCLALSTAQVMEITKQQRHTLGLATLLHEIGWLQLPIQLMGKRAPYSDREVKLVQSHVEIGLKMLRPSELPEDVYRVIGEHHERCDGSGYPKGLTAADLATESKILQAVDCYDENVHQLLDQPGMLPTNALRLLYRHAEQGRFDTTVVASLINVLGVYPVSSVVRLNTGEKAVVEQVFAHNHLEPIVRILYDEQETPLKTSRMVDLREAPQRAILHVLDPRDPKVDPMGILSPQFRA